MKRLLVAAAVLVGLAGVVRAEGVEAVSVRKIWDQGKHNAFTDLVRFKDKWYCTFREGDAHVGGDGKIRILVSSDGESWESAALIEDSEDEALDAADAPAEATEAVAGGTTDAGPDGAGE